MAEAITIACPECGKKINVASEAVGKKVRCKGCEHVFVVRAPAEKKAAKPAPAKAPAKAPAAAKKAPDPKAAKPKADDDEEDPNPYGVTSLDLAPRCPDCARSWRARTPSSACTAATTRRRARGSRRAPWKRTPVGCGSGGSSPASSAPYSRWCC